MAAARKITTPRRGEIYFVRFDPTQGAEIRKTPQALIIQNNVANRWSPITIVAAISSQFEEPLYPTEVLIPQGKGGLQLDSVALLNQIRSIDRSRLLRAMGRVNAETMARIDRALMLSLGLLKL